MQENCTSANDAYHCPALNENCELLTFSVRCFTVGERFWIDVTIASLTPWNETKRDKKKKKKRTNIIYHKTLNVTIINHEREKDKESKCH